ncbi:ribosomal protein S18-alanine N-acetyltransferase [Thalassovita taeanensis]|uniref:[Ribosomal protein bS18]-alanine N-acetyltransferase n=1 Tax=Thalassovita taeanensis TaxID=657014 RepID=A0A1H9D8B3_9RHOB|nr:ribosomal protein S18-alanine N-acetyltransferase [Thalassovita taeanensis]SEQ09694.1 ribosomal-protein-alanine N-acetyltransferase [Thalassovita taeanensis]
MAPEDLARLHAAAFTTLRPWSAAEFETLLASPYVFLAAQPQGFALGRVIADEAELLTLATDPAHRRQGLGRDLLHRYHDTAQQRGATTTFLEVAEDNQPAIALYHSDGYAIMAQRRDYYRTTQGTRLAALIMRRALP